MLFVCILELTVELRIEMKWNNDLKDETSEAFRNLANEFKSEVGFVIDG